MAVLEGAPRVPVALLLAVHHAALHGVLDLGREESGAQQPQAACDLVGGGGEHGVASLRGPCAPGPSLPPPPTFSPWPLWP